VKKRLNALCETARAFLEGADYGMTESLPKPNRTPDDAVMRAEAKGELVDAGWQSANTFRWSIGGQPRSIRDCVTGMRQGMWKFSVEYSSTIGKQERILALLNDLVRGEMQADREAFAITDRLVIDRWNSAAGSWKYQNGWLVPRDEANGLIQNNFQCTYSASCLVDEVPGPISPGCSLFAPSALSRPETTLIWAPLVPSNTGAFAY
jgi:hypothetical protein